MAKKGKYKFQKILTALVWLLLGSGTIMLLLAAISKRNNEHCVKTNIIISGVQNKFFIDKDDVIRILKKTNNGKLEEKRIGEIDLASMEKALQKNQWIRRAELFFDNNNVLQVRISEREPVSRIFTKSGKSFYLDSALKRLPLSDKFFARIPVFTNFPTDLIVLTKKDSNLLREIKILGEFIGSDPFWMAQIEQADINADGTFELIPKIGNQVIHFGYADEHLEKFRKLLTFYKQVQVKSGWNKYSAIDLRYKNQVIGIRRGADEIKMDSLKTIQIMKNIIATAQKHSDDTTNIQLIQPADNNNIINNHAIIDNLPPEEVSIKNADSQIKDTTSLKIEKSPAEQEAEANKSMQNKISTAKKSVREKVKESSIKADTKKKERPKAEPKAVMPPKSDYE